MHVLSDRVVPAFLVDMIGLVLDGNPIAIAFALFGVALVVIAIVFKSNYFGD